MLQLAAQHHFHQFNLRQLAGFPAADKTAVTQNGDAVADGVNLVEEVGDENQADAAIAQLAHQGEEHFHLLGIQAGGRFIKN